MAKLVAQTIGVSEPVLELRLGANLIGRGPANHFRINHRSVSARHCELIPGDGVIQLRDCNSTKGCFVNGRRVKRATLRSGQTLRLGEVEFMVESSEFTVVIPKVQRPLPVTPVTIPVEEMHCERHPDLFVTHQCTQCRKTVCSGCVNRLQLRGRTVRMFCPYCSRPVGVIGEPKPPIVLADGTMLCSRHSESRASFRCTGCGEVMCDACVFRFVGRDTWVRMLCPLCCETVEFLKLPGSKSKTLTSYLKDTIKLPFTRGEE
jgi:pSer/pThr/pTyr-binding forkhead associated (FHA) protein